MRRTRPKRTEEYGLDKPAATVQVRQRLLAGDARRRRARPARAPCTRGTCRGRRFSPSNRASLDELKKDPSEYRQKDLFDARGFNATRIEIVRAGQTLAFEKTKVKNKEGQDEEKWRQLTPQTRELDQPEFDALLSALTGIRATGFVDAAAAKGLEHPRTVGRRSGSTKARKKKRCAGQAGTDGFASRAGEPGAAKIDASAIDAVTKALQELK